MTLPGRAELSGDALEDRAALQLRLLDAVRTLGAGARPPYFAHLRLDTGRRELDVLLGNASRTGPGVHVVDWQTAPLAEPFFACDEGDEYELEVEGRELSGRVLQKNLLEFAEGELVRIETPRGALVRAEAGWRIDARTVPAIPLRPDAARSPFRSPLEVQLDPAQQRVVDLPPDTSVLLLGEAGFGKTTVGLHRLMALSERRGRAFRGAVMVPTEGLRRLTEQMLQRRGFEKLEIWTYEDWASSLARRTFRDLPRRESENTPSDVIRLKRHPALRSELEAFAREQPRPVRAEGSPSRGRPLASRGDLEHLFGDRPRMEHVVAASAGGLPARAVAACAEHTRIQFSEPAEAQYAHVDAEQLATVDGRRIDEGTPLEDAKSVDPEDYAVLFELERLRSEASGEPPVALAKFDCLLVDEAQEFAPLELALMRRALRPQGSVIVAGDAAQQVDATAHFPGWEGALRELGRPGAERTELAVSYRCPPDITELARAVRDPGRAPSGPFPSLLTARHATLFHLSSWLVGQLDRLLAEDATASVALVARSAGAARLFERVLRHAAPVHLALGGDFEFRPGLTVTCVQEVKGLEFDYVVLPDASAATYPDTAESRRTLYVALTRATHRLVLAAAGAWSPLLPPAFF